MPDGKKMNTVEIIKAMANPIAQQLGLEIWDVKFLKEGPDWILRVLIDKDDGIMLDDCERMSKALDKPLDELDPIEQSYSLEVSSPGIERELTTDTHLRRYIGSNVKLKLIRPHENDQKILDGQFINFNQNNVSIKDDTQKILVLPRKNISHINLNTLI